MEKDRRNSINEYQRAALLFQNFQNVRNLERKLRERLVIQNSVDRKLIKGQFRALASRLCKEHPLISTDAEVLNGAPHIEGTRLSVGTVLAKLHRYGSIQAVINIYKPHLSEEQVKEAIAYAQDFLEIACDPNETP